MLYQMFEAQRSLLKPISDFSQTLSKMFTDPSLPTGHGPFAGHVSAGYDLLHRLGKEYDKPEFGIDMVSVDGRDVVIHERVEMNLPFCELKRFKRMTDTMKTLETIDAQPPVLVVAPLSGHYATLLRDTVKTLLADHKVYITDWKNARNVPLEDGEFHLDDYVNYVIKFIEFVQSENAGECHVISVCQPTVPVLGAISLMASAGKKTPQSMTMMGGPIDARKSPTQVNHLATNKSLNWFKNNVIHTVPEHLPGAGRRVYPGFLQFSGFVAMNPDRHANSHYEYFSNLVRGDGESAASHRRFYDEYNAVLDMDADYYLETIETVFQEFKLAKGTWEVKDEAGVAHLVRPQDIKNTFLLTIEGELDDISGSGQTQAAQDLCSGIAKKNKTHYEVKGAGHYGIFSGRRWREDAYPVVKKSILSARP